MQWHHSILNLKEQTNNVCTVYMKIDIVSFLTLACSLVSGRKVIKKLSMEPPERISTLQTLWESQSGSEPGPCGKIPIMHRVIKHLFVYLLQIILT